MSLPAAKFLDKINLQAEIKVKTPTTYQLVTYVSIMLTREQDALFLQLAVHLKGCFHQTTDLFIVVQLYP